MESADEKPAPSVRSFRADEWRVYRRLRLGALEESPDAFCTTWAEARTRPESHWIERMAEGVASPREHPTVALRGDEPIGLAWGVIAEETPEKAEVIQVWVAPEGRGCGAGRLLLEAVVDWARGAGARLVRLGVTLGESPAVRLYERAGFRFVGESWPLRPGSSIRARTMELRLDD